MAAGRTETRYSAFISYSHRDAGRARALQRSLERYRLPKVLRAGSPAVDPRTGQLLPVFRDRDELTAAPDLSAEIRAAIGSARALVVVCTPDAARSAWVDREIALARALGLPVLCALFDGDSATAFAPALRAPGPDGAALSPLAADFRPGGDGRLALLKLVAALAGVGLDALVQRDAQARMRRALGLAAVAAVALLAIGVAAALALAARAAARAEQTRGVAMVEALVDQREQLAKAGNLELLQALNRAALAFFRGRDLAALPDDAQLLAARLLHGIAEDNDAAGDVPGLAEASAAAGRATRRLLDAAPADEVRLLTHAQSEYWAGLAAWRRGDLSAARRSFVGYATLAERLATGAPGRADWQREAGDAHSNLGTLAMRVGNLAEAGKRFRAAQAADLAAARLAPADRDVQGRIADVYGWRADVERLSGRLPAARRYREAQRQVLLDMQARDPDAAVETGLINNQLGLARLSALEGRWEDADRLFDSGRAAALARARRDRANADIARQARAFDLFQARAWLAMPPAKRPPAEWIGAMLRDCKAERARGLDTEAAQLCLTSRARLHALAGDAAAARSLLSLMRCQPGYSERWRLDLCDERARAISVIEDMGKQGRRR